MDLPELLEIQRINQALPFHDPIALNHTVRGQHYFMDLRHWSDVDRARGALRKVIKRLYG